MLVAHLYRNKVCYFNVFRFLDHSLFLIFQVKIIENLQHEHSVKIVLSEPPYAAKKLTVQGLTNDVTMTMQAIQSIMEPETPGSSLYARSLGYILVQKQ